MYLQIPTYILSQIHVCIHPPKQNKKKYKYIHVFIGEECPYPDGFTKDEYCNEGSCPTPCEGDWSDWSACDATCGPGLQIRYWNEVVGPTNGIYINTYISQYHNITI